MNVKDPVCGMVIEQSQALRETRYAGHTYHFCSAGCHQAFSAAPERYTRLVKLDLQEPVTLRSLVPLLLRLGRILSVLLPEYRSMRRFMRCDPEQQAMRCQAPRQFVEALLNLGPTFIKIGQVLSTRPDLLPKEYVAELAVLHERVPAFPYDDVEDIFQKSFGRGVSQVFSSFSEAPVAAASLAQVHFAVLPDGSEVAVKIQRPGIRPLINSDMVVLGWLISILGCLMPGKVRRLNLKEGFKEFRRYTLHELDFSLEAASLERFRANFREWKDIVFPEVCWNFTNSRVLTMSRVSGLRLNQVGAAVSSEERKRISRRLMELEMKMFITDGFFHADLHPGNIFFKPDGRIVILDAGMVGELKNRQRDRFLLYLEAVAHKSTRRAFYHLIKQTAPLPNADQEGFYGRFKELADRFLESTLSSVSLAQVYLGVITQGARFGFIFPSDLLLHAKALTTAEALSFTLEPDLRFAEAIKPIIAKEFRKRAFDPRRLWQFANQSLPELLLTGELPPSGFQYEEDQASGEYISGILNQERLLASVSQDLMRMLIDPFARKILTRRFDPEQTAEILEQTWDRYVDLEPGIPNEEALGSKITVRAGAATIAMYGVLTNRGLSEDEAADLIYKVAWEIYTLMGAIPWLIGSTSSGDGAARLKHATNAFRTFPFGSPGYRWRDVNAEKGVVAFDCLRCPVAEYFASHKLSELCVKTFCNLDFPLAEQWNSELERTGTLAGGAPCCDFRWRSKTLTKN